MDHQYGIPEIQQLMKGGERTTTTAASPSTTSPHFPSDFNFGFNLPPPPPPRHHRLYQFTTDQEMGFLPLGILGLGGSSSNLNGNPSGGGGGVGFSGFLEGGGFGGGGVGGDGGGTGRWPRQETLTLLEIRSRLDHKFKEANQKGPLWDEVSRIMSEEHGYQRSGKKCREKFENLYKYYKKTKEGKAGRQDGKHYRFFRQLEALYGDSNNLVSCPNLNTHFMSNALHEHHGLQGQNTMMNVTNVDNNVHGYHHQSLSLSNNYNSSELELMTSSSEGNDDSSSRRKKRSWKAKIKDFIDLNMKKLIERQDVWLEKLTKVIEDKEEQRMLKEEERRKIEASRLEREHMFWAKERKRMEARDVAVIEALQCLTGKTLLKPLCSSPQERLNGNNSDQTMTNNVSIKGNSSSTCWSEQEVIKLMEIRSSMESAFQEILSGCSDEFLWEEIAAKMIRLGFDQRSALSCKEKWECISNGMIIKEKKLMINKKRKENSSSCGVYYPRTEENLVSEVQGNVSSASTSNANANAENPSGAMAAGTNCFPFLMGDGDQNLWESYGLRLSKGENQ